MYTIDAANEPVISASLIDGLDNKAIESIAEVIIRIWLESWQLSNTYSLSLGLDDEDNEVEDPLSEFEDDEDATNTI